MNKLTINFTNNKAIQHFIDWLEGQGEASYWDWMSDREEEEEDANITALTFNYNYEKNSIDTKCGRLDGKWKSF